MCGIAKLWGRGGEGKQQKEKKKKNAVAKLLRATSAHALGQRRNSWEVGEAFSPELLALFFLLLLLFLLVLWGVEKGIMCDRENASKIKFIYKLNCNNHRSLASFAFAVARSSRKKGKKVR